MHFEFKKLFELRVIPELTFVRELCLYQVFVRVVTVTQVFSCTKQDCLERFLIVLPRSMALQQNAEHSVYLLVSQA